MTVNTDNAVTGPKGYAMLSIILMCLRLCVFKSSMREDEVIPI